MIKDVQARMGDGLRFAFRNFPISTSHPDAELAAEAAEAAAVQGRFWEMHDLLYEHQDRLGNEDLRTYAERLGLDLETFDSELAGHAYAARVREDFMSGVHSGVNGTPTFYVNGSRYDGSYETEALLAALRSDQDLERLALVHRPVPVGHLVEARHAVEDAAGLDPALEDVRQELLDIGACRGRASGDGHVLEERLHAVRNRLRLGNADTADGATRTCDLEGRDGRLVVTDALEDGVGSQAVGELADPLDRLVASFADDVRRPELLRQRGPTGMPAEDDDPLRAEAPCGNHSAQPNCAVADDGHRLPGADAGRRARRSGRSP